MCNYASNSLLESVVSASQKFLLWPCCCTGIYLSEHNPHSLQVQCTYRLKCLTFCAGTPFKGSRCYSNLEQVLRNLGNQA